jgi:hypothetical protein
MDIKTQYHRATRVQNSSPGPSPGPGEEFEGAGWSWPSRLRAALRVIWVRLRFVAIFAVAFLVIGNWETLNNYWSRLTTFSTSDAPQAVSGNTEYFCPMCPGVISDWPSKCPVCNMALVRRKKGGPVQLPDGVVSRMQYSPYRLQLAGVRTSVVDYMPLAREVASFGFVRSGDTAGETPAGGTKNMCVDLLLAHEDAAMLRAGQAVDVQCVARPGQGPWQGRVQSVDFVAPEQPLAARVCVEIDDPTAQLSPGMEISARIRLPMGAVEPFNSQPTNPEPLTADEPRKVFVCPEHGDVLGEAGGKCPRDGLALVERPLADNERLRWWCPMHPQVTANEAGAKCDECNGMILVPRVVIYRPHGEVLAVPESAIIDTGSRKLVYVDRGDGMFDGVEVVVGPRAAGYFAVVSGLQAGQKVASAGAFLLDAETRLNPNTATAYFGATTNSQTATDAEQQVALTESSQGDSNTPLPVPHRDRARRATQDASAEQSKFDAALSELPPDDERLARAQRTCPVTKLPLGSMGKPEKHVVDGRVVFLCCAGCAPALVESPDKYLPPAPADKPNERP